MPFDENTKKYIEAYVSAHLPDNNFYENYFWFISDVPLRNRLENEFKAGRYVYKILEGLQVENELRVAQSKIQILLYASIYEAVLHHVLLQDYQSTPQVKKLTTYQHKKPINISSTIRNKIQSEYKPSGNISVFESQDRTVDERKITFDDKAEAAVTLGLIDEKIKDIICEVYSMRNAIHLHAELRRGVIYDLDAAQKAYWHLEGFTKQIGDRLKADGKLVDPSHQARPDMSR